VLLDVESFMLKVFIKLSNIIFTILDNLTCFLYRESYTPLNIFSYRESYTPSKLVSSISELYYARAVESGEQGVITFSIPFSSGIYRQLQFSLILHRTLLISWNRICELKSVEHVMIINNNSSFQKQCVRWATVVMYHRWYFRYSCRYHNWI